MDNRKYPSVGEWFITIFIYCIPCINVIYLLYIVFNDAKSPAVQERRDYYEVRMFVTLAGFALFSLVCFGLGFLIYAGI